MRFKELRAKLQEEDGGLAYTSSLHPAVGPHNPDGAIDTPEVNISSLTDDSLNKLNAFLGASFSRSYINPANVMNQIRGKLQMVGLLFDYRLRPAKVGNDVNAPITSTAQRGSINEIGEGVHEFPLSYLGGTYGRYPTDPGYEPYHTDGISNKIGTSLVLCVEVTRMQDSTYRVKPYIKKTS